MTRTAISIAFATILLAGMACGTSDEPTPTAPATVNSTAAPGQTPADPASPSGDAVATVNGQGITRAEFDMRLKQAADAYAEDGVDVKDPGFQADLAQSLVERMVDEVLLLQAAAEAAITADAAKVDSQYAEVVGQFETDAEFRAALAQFHIDEEQLRENIEEAIVMDSYVDFHLESNVPDEELQPTEAELQQAYETYVSKLDGKIPTLEEVRKNLEAQARQQKISEQVTKLIDQLEAEADIQINS